MKTSEDIKSFELLVWELAESKDPKVLDKLIDYFDDNCQYLEIMWSLLHAIETYPIDVYIETIIKKIGNRLINYYEWLEIIFFRILNHEKYFNLFKKNLKFSNKEKILDFLNSLETNCSKQKSLIGELKKELLTS